MSKLVSIVIPCFNAQKWVAEAINSCLNQTYPNLEIIVIDDGSTDQSLEILKSYQDQIIWETGPNRGGNYARNRGFSLAKGDYIQYLDADDYLLPEKIEAQVRCLEATEGDVAYGNWRYQNHTSDGKISLEEIQICGPKTDFLESLLSNENWVPLVGVLFTRKTVEKTGGWDENLKAAQDRDFLISTAINNSHFVYQPDCHSIYRKHGNVTVSTSCRRRWLESHCLVMQKAARKLASLGRLSPQYRRALAHAYFCMGRNYLYSDYPYSQDLEHGKFLEFLQILEKALVFDEKYQSPSRNLTHKITQKLLGCRRTEILSYLSFRTKQWLNYFTLLVQQRKSFQLPEIINQPMTSWER